MPSKSKAQHNLMAMVAHDPKAAKRMGIPQSVGRDYVTADKGKKFGSGGTTMKESKEMMREEMKYLKKGKAPKRVIEHEAREHESMGMKEKYARGGGIEVRGKTKGKMVKMARGGGIEVRGKTRGKMC